MSKAQAQDSDNQATPAGRPVVLQVLPALTTGGVERGTVQIAAAITAAGGTALVASSGGPLAHELRRAGATHLDLPLASKNPVTMRRNTDRLVDIIRAHGVEIVHARSRAPAWSAHAAARRTGVPFVTTFHGTYNAGNALKRRYNSVMLRGDRVIAISEFIAEHIETNYEIDPARLRIINRGVDLRIFDPARVTAARLIQMAERLKLPDGVPVVLMPGRLTRWKGQAVLIEALAQLGPRGQRPEVCAVILGSDQGRKGYRSELEQLVRARDLEDVVWFADHVDDMPAAMMCADVVVSASTDPEAFGRVLVEAGAMGRPVIASDHGGAQNTVIPDATGWLTPPGDAAALADAIRTAIALSPDARERMAGRAMAYVRENFSLEDMCRKTLAVYRELIGETAVAEHAA
ncbi:MAG: glycosyltransferase family 4 protein [Alphaproteobacteria bacterium]|nr:glycosyltransferase family 4 protein [Alphaproteobacteria bacterium]